MKFPVGAQEFDAFRLSQPKDKIFHGKLRLNLTAAWNFRGFAGRNTGEAELVVETAFRIPPPSKPGGGADDTIVKFKQPRLIKQETNGTGAALDTSPQQLADADDQGMSLTASPRITFQEQIASQNGQALTLGIVQGSLQFQKQTATTVAYGTSCTVNLFVDPAPPTPTPPTLGKTLKRFAVTTKCGVNKKEPAAGEEGKLQEWWRGEAGPEPRPDDTARNAVKKGQTQVFVIGHASRTGSRAYNMVLAKDRADKILQILTSDSVTGKGAMISASSAGFDAAKAEGEAQQERFFEAVVDEKPAAAGAAGPGVDGSAVDQSS